MTRWFALCAVSALLVVGLIGCGDDDDDDGGAGRPTPVTVQFGYTINGGAAPMCNAIVDGDYRDRGLDVKLLPGGPVGGTFLNATNAIATNPRVDIAVDNDIVSLIEAKGKSPDAYKGFRVKGFADLWQKSPLGLLMRADFPLDSIKDAGKPLPNGDKIVFGSTPGAPIWGAIAEYAGVREKDLDIRTIGGDASALIAGKVDALLGFDTEQGVQARQAGFKVKFLPVSEIPGFQQPVFVALAREATLQKQPDLLEDWLRATIDGAKKAIDDQEGSVQNLKDRRCAGPKDDSEYERGVLRVGEPYFGPTDGIGQIDESQITSFSRAYSGMRNLQHTPTTSQLTDREIIDRVNE